MALIWNTSYKKCILLTKDIKSMCFFFIVIISSSNLFGNFFLFLVSIINHYLINRLHLFWDSFEWFCLQISHHHHHVVLVARISLTLSRLFSRSFIASGRSSGQHPVSSHSCWMYVRAGRSAFAWPCVGVHKSTSLMSSNLLLQQCPACLVRLTWIVFVIRR